MSRLKSRMKKVRGTLMSDGWQSTTNQPVINGRLYVNDVCKSPHPVDWIWGNLSDNHNSNTSHSTESIEGWMYTNDIGRLYSNDICKSLHVWKNVGRRSHSFVSTDDYSLTGHHDDVLYLVITEKTANSNSQLDELSVCLDLKWEQLLFVMNREIES